MEDNHDHDSCPECEQFVVGLKYISSMTTATQRHIGKETSVETVVEHTARFSIISDEPRLRLTTVSGKSFRPTHMSVYWSDLEPTSFSISDGAMLHKTWFVADDGLCKPKMETLTEEVLGQIVEGLTDFYTVSNGMGKLEYK